MPGREREAQLPVQLLFPKHLAGGRLEAEQITHLRERIDDPAVDSRCGERATLIILGQQRALVSVFPQELAGFGVEAVDGVLLLIFLLAVIAHRVGSPVGGHHGRRARADRGPPEHLRICVAPIALPVDFLGDPVVVRPPVNGPVTGPR